MGNKKRVFVASSSDLSDERQKLKTLLYDEGFEPVLWEDFDHSIKKDRFQTWINETHLTTSDVVIFMVKSRIGEFTLEEFKFAYSELGKSIERMYVYFLNPIGMPPKEEADKIYALKDFLEDNEKKLYLEKENYLKVENHFLKQLKHINNVSKKEKKLVEKKLGCCEYDIVKVAGEILEELSKFIKKNSCEFCDEVKYSKVQKNY